MLLAANDLAPKAMGVAPPLGRAKRLISDGKTLKDGAPDRNRTCIYTLGGESSIH